MENLEIKIKTLKSHQFVGLRNYTNSNGEVSNQTFLVGLSYSIAKEKDLLTVINFDIINLKDKFDLDLLKVAKEELIKSLSYPNQNASSAQIDTYNQVSEGLKSHKDTNELYVYGFLVNKKVLIPGIYKEVKSKPLTIIKNYLTSYLNLKTAKFRLFKVGHMDTIKINGELLTNKKGS